MALSDPGGILASPFTIINRSDEKLDSYNEPTLEEQDQSSLKISLTVNENLGFNKVQEKKLIQKNPTEQNP